MIKKVHINEEFMIVDDEEEMQYSTKVIKIYHLDSKNNEYKLEKISNPEVIDMEE